MKLDKAIDEFNEHLRSLAEQYIDCPIYMSDLYEINALAACYIFRDSDNLVSSYIIEIDIDVVVLPDKYIDYLIVHEACHAYRNPIGTKATEVIFDHDYLFYDLLEKKYPNWRDIENEIRKLIAQHA